MDDKKLGNKGQERALQHELEANARPTPTPKEQLDGNGIANKKAAPLVGSESSHEIDQKLRMAGGMAKQLLAADTSEAVQNTNSFMRAAESLNKSRLDRQMTEIEAMSSRKTIDRTVTTAESIDRGARDIAGDATTDVLVKDVRRLLHTSTRTGARAATSAETTNTLLANVYNFQRGPHLRYMSNNLAVQYQQAYLQKTLVTQIQNIGSVLEAKLEAIKLNTAASEIRKRSLMDLARETIIRNTVSSAGERVKDRFLDFFGPWLMENVVEPARDLGAAYAESDAFGAGTVRTVRDAAVSAKEKVSAKRQSLEEEWRNQRPLTPEEKKEKARQRLKDIRQGVKDLPGRVRDHISGRAATARDAVEERREAIRQQAETLRDTAADRLGGVAAAAGVKANDLSASAEDRLGVIREDVTAFTKDRTQRLRDHISQSQRESAKKIFNEPVMEARASDTGDDLHETITRTSVKDPLLSEVAEFHSSFKTYATSSEDKAYRILELLSLISQGGTGGSGGDVDPEDLVGDAPAKRGFWSRIKGVGSVPLKELIKLPWRGVKAIGRGYAATARGSMRLAGSVLGRLSPFKQNKVDPFTDVYRKGDVHIGSPLVTAKRLRAGLVFADGEPVGDVADIDRPVMDPETMEVLISSEDITAGLVDVHGTPLSKRGATTSVAGKALDFAGGLVRGGVGMVKTFFSGENPLFGLYGKMFESLGGIITGTGNLIGKTLMGALGAGTALGKGALSAIVSPMMDMYKGLFGVGMNVISGGMKGAGRLLGRLFGFDVKGGVGASRDDLEEVIGDRLDDIYELLLDRLVARKKGDLDGDGDREGSYADYKQRMEERRRKRLEDKQAEGVSDTAKSGGVLGSLAALFGLNKGNKSPGTDEEEDASEDDGGIMSALAGGAAGTYLASKAGVAKRLLGKSIGWIPGLKKVGGKLAASGLDDVAEGAAKAGTKASAAAATKAATKTAAKAGVKSALGKSAKYLLKRAPIIGAGMAAYFAYDRAMDGDFVGAAGEAASGILSFVPFLGTAASMAIDGWLAYRDLTSDAHKPVPGDIRDRMKYYGVEPKREYLKPIIKLEQVMAEVVTGRRDKVSVVFVKKAGEAFGFDVSDKLQVDYLIGWVNGRMMPIFRAYAQAAANEGVDPTEIANVDEETLARINEAFAPEAASIAAKVAELKPTMTAYRVIVLGDVLAGENEYLDTGDVAKADPKVPQQKQALSRLESRRRHMTQTRPETSAKITSSSVFDEEGRFFNDQRFKAYGVIGNGQREALIKVERSLVRNPNFRRYSQDQITELPVIYNDALARSFGVDVQSAEAKRAFSEWMTHRMAKVLKIYLQVAQEFGTDYLTTLTLTGDKASTFMDMFIERVNEIMPTISALLPYPEGKVPEAEIQGSEALTDSKVIELSGHPLSKNQGRAAGIDPSVRAQVRSANLTGEFAKQPPSSSARNLTQTSTHPYDRGKTANDNNQGPGSSKTEGLGSLSAHYESGNRGSSAIGYDSTGGTSYGKYQIASKTGTFNKFISWLYAKGGDARYIAERLMAAGAPNTGSRVGGVPTEWRKIVAEGLMGDYEHEFIKATHYDKALFNLSTDLQERVKASPALQDVLWSTAVQHGPVAAATLMTRSASSDSDDASLVRKLYEERSTQFGRSNARTRASVFARFVDESERALAMLRKESKPVQTADAGTGDESSAKAEGLEDTYAPLDPKGMEELKNSDASQKSREDAALVKVPKAGDQQAPSRRQSSEPVETFKQNAQSAPQENAAQKRQQETEAALNTLAGLSPEELRKALEQATGSSVDQLHKVNENLGRLTEIMEQGLGKDGSIAQLGNTVKDASERPVNVTIPVVNQGNQNTPNSSRLKSIDLDLSRKGSNVKYG